ncbi:hypothetical protein OROMI_018285 [Orobanche minor]
MPMILNIFMRADKSIQNPNPCTSSSSSLHTSSFIFAISLVSGFIIPHLLHFARLLFFLTHLVHWLRLASASIFSSKLLLTVAID